MPDPHRAEHLRQHSWCARAQRAGLTGLVLGSALLLGCTSAGSASAGTVTAVDVQPLFVELSPASHDKPLAVPAACPAKLAPEPARLFGQQVELSLPLGLEAAALEAGGGVARWTDPDACAGEAQLALLTYELDPRGPALLIDWHRRLLDRMVPASERELERVAGAFGEQDLSVILGHDDGPEVYVRILVHDTRLVAAAFMTTPGEWAGWMPTFEASATSLALAGDPATS